MKSGKRLKKVWVMPELTVHGDVEKLTTGGSIPSKKFGSSDGATWAGQSVQWAS